MYRTRVPRVDETRTPARTLTHPFNRRSYGLSFLPTRRRVGDGLLRSNLDHLERRHSMAGCEARNNRAAEGVKIARNLAVSSRTSWHKKRRRRLEALDRVGPGWAVR